MPAIGYAELAMVVADGLGYFADEGIEIIGHDLKRALGTLRWSGACVNATLFDTMLAHSLLEPDMRHTLQYLAEACLGYTPTPVAAAGELNLQTPEGKEITEKAMKIQTALIDAVMDTSTEDRCLMVAEHMEKIIEVLLAEGRAEEET